MIPNVFARIPLCLVSQNLVENKCPWFEVSLLRMPYFKTDYNNEDLHRQLGIVLIHSHQKIEIKSLVSQVDHHQNIALSAIGFSVLEKKPSSF